MYMPFLSTVMEAILRDSEENGFAHNEKRKGNRTESPKVVGLVSMKPTEADLS